MRFLLFTILLGASAYVSAALMSDDDAHRRIINLQQQVQVFEARIARLEAALATNKGPGEFLAQMDALKNELAQLRGQIEVQTHESENAQKRSRDLYSDLDARMRQLERNAAAPPQPPPVAPPTPAIDNKQSAPTGPPPSTKPGAVNSPSAEIAAYDAAYAYFKSGNYAAAITRFNNFVQTYPNSQLASGAQYWIGNSFYAMKDFPAAIAAQQKLLSTYPISLKAPDALLNISSSQLELGQRAAAKKSLEEIVAKYPMSNAAELAKQRLSNWR